VQLNDSLPHASRVAQSPALNRYLRTTADEAAPAPATGGGNSLPRSLRRICDDLADYHGIFEELSGTTNLQAAVIQQLLAEKNELAVRLGSGISQYVSPTGRLAFTLARILTLIQTMSHP